METLKAEDISSLIKKYKNLKLTQTKYAPFCGMGIRIFLGLEKVKQTLHLSKAFLVLGLRIS